MATSIPLRWRRQNFSLSEPRPVLLSSSGPIARDVLTDISNTQYLGSLSFGTPSQHLEVIFDTGSSDVWVRREKFDDAASWSFHALEDRASVTYGAGEVLQGDLAEDRLKLGDVSWKQSMLLADVGCLPSVVSDGLVGLAMPELSHTGETYLQNLRKQGISKFSFALSGPDGESFFFLGMPSASLYQADSLRWTPSYSSTWWSFQGALSVGGDTFLAGEFLLDSGTSYMALPADKQYQLLRLLVPQHASCALLPAGLYQCPCGPVRSLEVVVEGETFKTRELLSPEDGGGCIFEVQQLPPDMPFILGDSFLRSVVAIFDLDGRIGLARRAERSYEPYAAAESSQLYLAELCCLLVVVLNVVAMLIRRRSTRGDWDYRMVT